MLSARIETIKERLGQRWPELVNKSKSLSGFRAQATLYGGTERHSGEALTLLYVGNGANLAFLLSTLFKQYAVQREFGSQNIWRAGAFVERHRDAADLSVIDLPWPYESRFKDEHRVVELPAWVRQKLAFGRTWEEVAGKFRKSARGEEMRKIRKYDLTYAASRDPDIINDFYDNMYLPHTRHRFGDSAPVASRAWMMRCATRGILLQVLRGQEFIAGSVISEYDGQPQSLWGGFAGHDWQELEGATSAIYYYSIQFAFATGYRELDYCGSRPLLNDGVFKTKRRWGAAVYDDWSLETLLLRINRFDGGVSSFLANNPLLVRQGDQLVGKLLSVGEPVSASMVKKAAKRFASPGVDALNIYAMNGVHNDAPAAAESAACTIQIFDLQAVEDPATAYCES